MDFNLIPEEIRSEFQINDNGQAFASRRAIARLAGVNLNSVQQLLERIADQQNCPEIFQAFAGQRFQPDQQIPDILAALIFGYYAHECQERYRSEQAKKVCRAFNAIGIRSWIQQQLGWQQSAQPSQPQSIAQMFLTIAQGLVEAENQREQLKTEQNRQRLELQEAKESINFLISARQEALNQLNEVERSPLIANPKSTRAKLVELVRKYSATNNIGFGAAFNNCA